jgi:hypothetical protein
MTTESLLAALEREHRQWIDEVVAALAPAKAPDAGPWARWNALRYLQTTLPAHLDRERRLVQGLAAELTDDQQETVWALGELLEAQRAQLGHLIGLCHRAEQFATVTGKIVTALRHWCRAVENDLGPLMVEAMPRRSREVLARLAPETVGVGG